MNRPSACSGPTHWSRVEPATLTEGEFDAVLLWQEAGNLVGVATL